MNKIVKSWKWQYTAVISIIVLIVMPVSTSFQHGLIELLYAGQVGGVKAALTASTGRQKLVSAKITCIQIINEDYEGLKLSYPGNVLVDSVKKEIYVVDSGNNRILIYASDFYPLSSINKTYGIDSPVGIAIDSEGYLFIAQSRGKGNKKGRISVLNPSLGWKKDIYFEGFEGADNFTPNDIAISNKGHIYVTGNSYRGVVVMNKEGIFSHILTPVDRFGKSSEEKATIRDVEINNQGNIYLLSEDMGRIYVYDSQERYLFKFGQKGGSSGKLSRPRGIAVDGGRKRIYVIDYMRHTANAYSDDGRFLFEFGGKGWGKGWFNYPTDIAVDTLGNVLIVDTFNNRVQVLKIQEAPSIEKVKELKPKVTIAKKVSEAKVSEHKVPAHKVSGHKVSKPEIPEYYLLTSDMNLREESNTESNIIKLLRKGEKFQILDKHKQDKSNQWYFIKTESGLTGWFCGIYNEKARFKRKFEEPLSGVSIAEKVPMPKSDKYYLLTSDMNLRKESNAESNIIKLLRKGEKFQILDEHKQDKSNQWYFIKTESGITGWFCGIYNGMTRFKRMSEL